MCASLFVDMCINMCTDTYVDMRAGMFVDVCMGIRMWHMRTYMRTDMFVDIHIMCTDVRIEVGAQTCLLA